MTYFGFLALFLGIPLAIVCAANRFDQKRGRILPETLSSVPAWAAVFIHVIVALIYTTPWDNYLVATGVWTYNPKLVTGITLGWVPIEEYTFFILQTVLTGSWLLFLARRIGRDAGQVDEEKSGADGGKIFPVDQRQSPRTGGKTVSLAFLGILWLFAGGILLSGWKPGTYLALILFWAIPPIALQIYFGADLLWRYRRLVFTALASITIYLSAADSLAIGSGTWTIAPSNSLNIHFGGVLPVEEFIFFLVTNTLIVFGITLLLSVESRVRIQAIMDGLGRRKAHQLEITAQARTEGQ